MSIPKRCPKCGGDIEVGYGFMGGGIGPYAFCVNAKCDYFVKEQDRELRKPRAPTNQGEGKP